MEDKTTDKDKDHVINSKDKRNDKGKEIRTDKGRDSAVKTKYQRRDLINSRGREKDKGKGRKNGKDKNIGKGREKSRKWNIWGKYRNMIKKIVADRDKSQRILTDKMIKKSKDVVDKDNERDNANIVIATANTATKKNLTTMKTTVSL